MTIRNSIRLDGFFVTLSAAPENEKHFKIMAYSGDVVTVGGQKLMFDVAGMTFKNEIPVLREHQRDRVVGFGTGQAESGAFVVNGVFSESTSDGVECLALAREGFPWQASVGLRPVKIKTFALNERANVNNRIIIGPVEIWLESELKEVSFVSLGADDKTGVSVFSDTKDHVPVEIEKNEPLFLGCEKLFKQLRMDGTLHERQRIIDILNIDCPVDRRGVLLKAIQTGKTLNETYQSVFTNRF